MFQPGKRYGHPDSWDPKNPKEVEQNERLKRTEDLFFEKIHTIKPLARLARAKREKAKKIKLQMKKETI